MFSRPFNLPTLAAAVLLQAVASIAQGQEIWYSNPGSWSWEYYEAWRKGDADWAPPPRSDDAVHIGNGLDLHEISSSYSITRYTQTTIDKGIWRFDQSIVLGTSSTEGGHFGKILLENGSILSRKAGASYQTKIELGVEEGYPSEPASFGSIEVNSSHIWNNGVDSITVVGAGGEGLISVTSQPDAAASIQSTTLIVGEQRLPIYGPNQYRGGKGTVEVIGANSHADFGTVILGSNIQAIHPVANDAFGRLTISEGASLSGGMVTVGRYGGQGVLKIDGEGTTAEITTLNVGKGNVVLSNSSYTHVVNAIALSSGTITFGGETTATATGTLTATAGISGTGVIRFNHTDPNYTVTLPLQGAFDVVHEAGDTTFLAGSGGYSGATTVSGGSVKYLSIDSFGLGNVTVTGPNSTLKVNSGRLEIGILHADPDANTSTRLTIANGGKVDIRGGVDAGSTRTSEWGGPTKYVGTTITIDGAGSELNTGRLRLVGGPTTNSTHDESGATLTLSNGGKVTLNATSNNPLINLGIPSSNPDVKLGFERIGVINIGGEINNATGIPSAAVGAGIISTSSLLPVLIWAQEGSRGVVNFNHTESTYLFDPALQGNIAINHFAGVTHLTSALNDISGEVRITGGDLHLDNGATLGSGIITIGTGSRFYNHGALLANEIVWAGGEYIQSFVNVSTIEGFTVKSDAPTASNVTATFLDGSTPGASEVTVSFGPSTGPENPFLLGETLNISGLDETPFVLQLTSASIHDESFLAWLNDEGEWVNATQGNYGDNLGAIDSPSLLSYNDFKSSFGDDFILSDHLGAWGRDGNSVWAILNHNSEFAYMVPEPTGYGVIGLTAVGLVFLWKRR